jgi:hypothetical protein
MKRTIKRCTYIVEILVVCFIGTSIYSAFDFLINK